VSVGAVPAIERWSISQPMSDRPDILREYRVTIVPADEAGPQPTYSNDLGLRTKFGGNSDAI
jgi:hypothetical protein